jgi:hypothetical protein
MGGQGIIGPTVKYFIGHYNVGLSGERHATHSFTSQFTSWPGESGLQGNCVRPGDTRSHSYGNTVPGFEKSPLIDYPPTSPSLQIGPRC